MPALFAIWICASVYLNCAGWLLAGAHQLNAPAYALALAPGIMLAWVWAGKKVPRWRPAKLSRRFRRPLPAIFALAAGLVFAGGLLYAPSNYDALTYRLPRLLNWLLAGKWFWISTINDRQNYSGVGWEWLAMPFLALFRSDRGLFLINALGFLLMPGLLFSIFRNLGMARKVAWTWMWLLPLAYGYLTQAGSIGNDLTGTLFGLLSVYFGLRARHSRRVTDLWLAGLAAALMTGVKLSNLPLALPCLMAGWPAFGLLRKHVVGTVAIAFAAVAVSALPMMALNQIYAGSWTGDPQDKSRMQIRNPVAGLIANGFLVGEQALMPPVLPVSNQLHRKLTGALPGFVERGFPRLFSAKVNEIPGEEGAGLNLAISLPLLIGLGAACRKFRPGALVPDLARLFPPVAAAAWIAFLVYLAKMGSEAGPRLLLPYYPLVLMPGLMLSTQADLLRRRWWRFFLGVLALGALPVLILSVARPLWPAQTVTSRLAAAHPASGSVRRLATTYAAYAQRNDILAPLRDALPADVREVGFIGSSNDTSYSLWRPFGARVVKDLRPEISRFLAQPDVEWVVVKQDIWPEISSSPLEDWAQAHDGKIVFAKSIIQLVSAGPETWCLLRFENAAMSDK